MILAKESDLGIHQTLAQVYMFFMCHRFSAAFSTIADDRQSQSRRPSQYGLPDPGAVKKTHTFLKEKQPQIMKEMQKEMTGYFDDVSEETLVEKHGFYSVSGVLADIRRVLGYDCDKIDVTESQNLVALKSGAVFGVIGETRDRVDGIRYSKGVKDGCEDLRVASCKVLAGFAYFTEGTGLMLYEEQQIEDFADTGGTHMVGTHSEAFMVNTTNMSGDGDVPLLQKQCNKWTSIFKGLVGDCCDFSYEKVK